MIWLPRLQLAGRNDEANKAFAEFEQKSLKETDRRRQLEPRTHLVLRRLRERPDKALSVATA